MLWATLFEGHALGSFFIITPCLSCGARCCAVSQRRRVAEAFPLGWVNKVAQPPFTHILHIC